ncbi:MAG: hypothetical protein NTZ26_09260 [Candidatus Aminicenantes bacterium]|nr:hypothetical protein [Candidatus Aminicenantes bacterium]
MSHIKYWILGLFILAGAAFGPACSKSRTDQPTTVTESGLQVVKNPSRPTHGKASLSLTEEFALSGRTEGDDSFETIDSFAVDADGTIFLCDEEAALIKVFSGEGALLGSFPTSGPEQGGLERPHIAGISSGGELAVESGGHRKLVFYSRDGRPVRETSLAGRNIFRLSVDGRGRILLHHYRYVRPNVLYYVRLYDDGLKEIKTYGQSWEPQSVGNALYAYLPILWWTIDARGGVVYGNPQRYEIQVFDPEGVTVRIIRKEHHAVPISEAEKEAYQREYAKAPYVRIHFPEAHSAYQKFTVDEQGRIYVMTWERAPGGVGYWYDVFDEKGIYTARIPLSRMPQIWSGDRLYTLERYASGKVVLTRNRFEWTLR